MSQESHRRRLIIAALKLSLAAGIFAYLFYRLRSDESDVFARLVNQPKHWHYLALAQLMVIAGTTLNFLRWYLLVRALGLDFHLRDAFRLGALGHLLNQVSFGSVGGDLFKAVFIAREQPEKRTEAVASVVIDRVVGLYAMLIVATAGYAIAGQYTNSSEANAALQSLMALVTTLLAVGTVGIALLMTPALTGPKVQQWAAKIPVVGHTLSRLIAAAACYRDRREYLFLAIGCACCTHTLLVLAIWSIGQGLPMAAPSLATTFLVGPMSLAAGALPLTPSGLGTFEAAMDALYHAVGAQEGDGLMVALAYRMMTYVMAGLGAVYYLNARKTVGRVMHEAEVLADEMD
jgi:glycosyltransferase 2 family protein